MKNLIHTLLFSLIFLSCSKENDTTPDLNTLGYYKGMSHSDYEYITGQHLESQLLKPHHSGNANTFQMPNYNYYEVDGVDYNNETKGFYPTLVFNIYDDRLVSVDITFNHWGTKRSNESPMLYEQEHEEVMNEVKKYFNKYEIDASFEFTPYEDHGVSIEEGYKEITGQFNLE